MSIEYLTASDLRERHPVNDGNADPELYKFVRTQDGEYRFVENMCGSHRSLVPEKEDASAAGLINLRPKEWVLQGTHSISLGGIGCSFAQVQDELENILERPGKESGW